MRFFSFIYLVSNQDIFGGGGMEKESEGAQATCILFTKLATQKW